jgi:hypothetical protein
MEEKNSFSITLKNGFTSNNHPRHYIVHNYRDHSQENPGIKDNCATMPSSMYPHKLNSKNIEKGVQKLKFPSKLHNLLDYVQAKEISHIVSWQSHGRAFKIHKEKECVDLVLPFYFEKIKLSSFRRQLNHYGFQRITQGPDKGAYYHELFLRGMSFLAEKMVRIKVRGTMVRGATSPETEPDFYRMPKLNVTSPSTLAIALPNLCKANDEMEAHHVQQINPKSFLYDAERNTLLDVFALEEISLENDRSAHFVQHFSREECLVMHTFLHKTFC